MSDPSQPTLARRLVAEALGTGCLLMALIGSGIMAVNLSEGNIGVALMGIALPVGAILSVLIMMFAPISGAHFNPAVTIAIAALGDMKWRDVPAYVVTQIVSAIAGIMLAHLMFGLPLYTLGTTARTGPSQWLSEVLATFGLFAVIWATARLRSAALPYAVGAYVFAAIWFTSSTCFANPAVTISRLFTDTICSIRPQDVLPFIACQAVGAAAATALFHWLVPTKPVVSLEKTVPEAEPVDGVTRKRSFSGPLTPPSH